MAIGFGLFVSEETVNVQVHASNQYCVSLPSCLKNVTNFSLASLGFCANPFPFTKLKYQCLTQRTTMTAPKNEENWRSIAAILLLIIMSMTMLTIMLMIMLLYVQRWMSYSLALNHICTTNMHPRSPLQQLQECENRFSNLDRSKVAQALAPRSKLSYARSQKPSRC